jgi:leucyl-tRNA synthetase
LHPGLRQFWVACKQYAIQTGQRPEDTTSVNIDGGGQRKEIKLQGTETVG